MENTEEEYTFDNLVNDIQDVYYISKCNDKDKENQKYYQDKNYGGFSDELRETFEKWGMIPGES